MVFSFSLSKRSLQFIVAACSLAFGPWGCSDDSGGTAAVDGAAEAATPDSSTFDSPLADSTVDAGAVMDSSIVDSGAADAAGDTGSMTDASATDSGVADGMGDAGTTTDASATDASMDSGGSDTGSAVDSGTVDAASNDGAADVGTPEASAPDSSPSDSAADGTSDGGPQMFVVTVGPGGAHTFEPSSVTIHVGDTVEWQWQSSGHTVTSGSACTADNAFCSPADATCATTPTSDSGSTYSHTFTQTGSFPFFCRPHCSMGMTGTVVVE
jgi:plastocyanin